MTRNQEDSLEWLAKRGLVNWPFEQKAILDLLAEVRQLRSRIPPSEQAEQSDVAASPIKFREFL